MTTLNLFLSEQKVALGVDGAFGRAAMAFDDLDLDLDVEVSVRVRKAPYWSWLPDWFNEPVSIHGQFDEVLFNVLDSPLDADQKRVTERLACLNLNVGPMPSPFFSLELRGFPGPHSYWINGFELAPEESGTGPFTIGFLNPVEESGGGTYTPAENPALVDVATSWALTPFQNAVRETRKHAVRGC